VIKWSTVVMDLRLNEIESDSSLHSLVIAALG